MAEAKLWTLDELVGLVGQALSVDYDGAPSARIRDLPDRRLVRWYVTKGLVDRPAATSGRNALYGRRHLLQLVAIKRRQAQGRSLADIQAELTGATDSTLERLARLDAVPAAAPTTPTTTAPPGFTAPSPPPGGSEGAAQRPRFWIDRPTAIQPPPLDLSRPLPLPPTMLPRRHPEPTRMRPTPHAPAAAAWPLRAIELSPGVTLLVDPATTLDADPDAVRDAAQALLALLVPPTTVERSST